MRLNFLIFALSCLSYTSSSQTPQWLNYTNDMFISHITFEGQQVWLSTQGGLVRLDPQTGAKQTFLPSNSGLRNVSVGEVLVNADGTKWIGTEGGGLLFWDGADDWQQFYHINTGDTLIDIKNLHTDSNGVLWFLSDANANCSGCTKLFRYDGNTFSKIESPGNGEHFRYLAVDTSGVAWVALRYKIIRIDQNLVQTVFDSTNTPLLYEETATQFGFDRNNQMYCTVQRYINGIYYYRLLRFDGLNWAVLDSTITGQSIGAGNAFFNDSNGDLWIPSWDYNTKESKLLKFDGANWTAFSENDLGLNALPGIDPVKITMDQNGHLWATMRLPGSSDRVHEFDWSTWKSYNTEIFPLPYNYPTDIVFDQQQNVWIGGYDMLTRFDGLSWKSYTKQDFGGTGSSFEVRSLDIDPATGNLLAAMGMNQTPILFDGSNFTTPNFSGSSDAFDLKFHPDGTIWAASHNSGLGHFDGNNWFWYNTTNAPFQTNIVWDIEFDLAGNVWVANYYGGLLRFDGTNWTVFNSSNSPVPNNDIGWMYIDQSGQLWTDGGDGRLLRYNGSSWDFITTPGAGTPHFFILDIVEDNDQSYWISSNYAGLFHWDGGSSWTQYDVTNSAISNNYVRKVRIDPMGNKWLLHSTGISVFNPDGISNQVINPPTFVRGQVFFDTDQNGSKAPTGEPGMPGASVLLLPDSLTVFTTLDGLYTVFPAPGQYTAAYQAKPGFVLTSDSSMYHFTVANTSLGGFDFGAWTADLTDSIDLNAAIGFTRCGQETPVWIHVSNQSFQDAEGAITFTYDPALEFISAQPAPDEVFGNTLRWNYTGLPFQASHTVQIVFRTPGPNATGDTLLNTITATREENGQVVRTIQHMIASEVRCSYDPNDKLVRPTGPSDGSYSLLADALEYTIRFQNTGNDTAFTIIIRDTLDPQFDFERFEILASSHPVQVQMTATGVVTFRFENIALLWQTADEAASQGFVKYRLRPRAGLTDGAAVYNTAHIYFDFNPGITTNTTQNVLVNSLPTLNAPATPWQENSWRLYPNPTNGSIRVDWPEKSGFALRIFDATGRLSRQVVSNGPQLLVEGLEPGLYFVCPEGSGCRKLVVLH